MTHLQKKKKFLFKIEFIFIRIPDDFPLAQVAV